MNKKIKNRSLLSPSIKLQKAYIASILAQIIPVNQLSLSIQSHRLTEALETLESAGFTGDLAIFMLACCQRVAV
jgi:hypothetical protein